MIISHIRPGEQPLDQEDIDICQHVFDSILSERRLLRESEEAANIAVIILDLYRHGVTQEASLVKVVKAAQ